MLRVHIHFVLPLQADSAIRTKILRKVWFDGKDRLQPLALNSAPEAGIFRGAKGFGWMGDARIIQALGGAGALFGVPPLGGPVRCRLKAELQTGTVPTLAWRTPSS